jgi:hypothetical protein
VIAEKPTMNDRKASAEAAAQVLNCWQAADDPKPTFEHTD